MDVEEMLSRRASRERSLDTREDARRNSTPAAAVRGRLAQGRALRARVDERRDALAVDLEREQAQRVAPEHARHLR